MNNMEIDTLSDLANKYASDKGTVAPSTGHHGPRLHFTTIYNKYMESMRNEDINLLEIGIGSGPSLKMWYDYFYKAKIHAIDIVNSSQYNNDRVKTYIADQTKRETLQNVVDSSGSFDIIVDDGGHMMGQQQISLGYMFKYLKNGGLYFIEDLHTSFWPHNGFKDLYGQSLDINSDRSNTTVNVIEGYIKTGEINSEFMTEDEMKYLNENIKECKIFDLPETMYGPNKLALFIKK
jgi:hypothetical protein